MIKLAVVGDIGSGKSYAAKKFGYPVFDAAVDGDKVALLKPDKEVKPGAPVG